MFGTIFDSGLSEMSLFVAISNGLITAIIDKVEG